MQSTGQTATQAVSFVPMQGWAIMWAMTRTLLVGAIIGGIDTTATTPEFAQSVGRLDRSHHDFMSEKQGYLRRNGSASVSMLIEATPATTAPRLSTREITARTCAPVSTHSST